MKTYLIHCDFLGDDIAASSTAGVLNKYEGVRYCLNAWIIRSDKSIAELESALDIPECSGMYYVVAEINSALRYRQNSNVARWITAHHVEGFDLFR